MGLDVLPSGPLTRGIEGFVLPVPAAGLLTGGKVYPAPPALPAGSFGPFAMTPTGALVVDPTGGSLSSIPDIIRSDKDTEFTGALVTNAQEQENLPGLTNNNGIINAVTIYSVQNLAWEVNFFSSDTFDSADADLDTFIDRVEFSEGEGLQIAGAGLFRYAVTGLEIPYVDDDATNELHVALVNRSAVAKLAGAPGEIVIRTTVTPIG